MKEQLEKFNAMDTGQKLIVVGVIVSIFSLAFFLFSGSDKEIPTGFDDLETPDNRNAIEEYNSKLDAYNDNRDDESEVSLEFDLGAFENQSEDVDMEKELMEREIDSLMNENRSDYTSKPSGGSGTSSRQHSSTPNRTVSRRPTVGNTQTKENVNSDFQDFFSSAPEVVDNSTDPSVKTDPFIYAVIHGDHTIKQGERVKLRLTKKATIAGMDFNKNSYVYAFPTFQNNRVQLNINSINHVPVDIAAYDTEDSAIGLYVKGAKMVGEVADETSKDAVDDVDVGGVPIGSTIKQVFQKKQQQPTVTLLNNTKLILKPNKS